MLVSPFDWGFESLIRRHCNQPVPATPLFEARLVRQALWDNCCPDQSIQLGMLSTGPGPSPMLLGQTLHDRLHRSGGLLQPTDPFVPPTSGARSGLEVRADPLDHSPPKRTPTKVLRRGSSWRRCFDGSHAAARGQGDTSGGV